MQDSFKGMFWTVTIIGIFITAIMGFVAIFPQEQDIIFSGQDNHGYLIANNTDLNIETNLNILDNQSSNAMEQWDITTGYMGSGQIKSGQYGVLTIIKTTVFSIKTLAGELFTTQNGKISPIIYIISIIGFAFFSYFGYMLYKFIRTGL